MNRRDFFSRGLIGAIAAAVWPFKREKPTAPEPVVKDLGNGWVRTEYMTQGDDLIELPEGTHMQKLVITYGQSDT